MLFRSLNFPQETDKKLCLIDSATCWSVLSSKFCNMLMCATICPQGSGFSLEVQSEGRVQRILLYTSVCVIYGAVDEEDVEILDRLEKWNPLRGSPDLPSSKHRHMGTLKFPPHFLLSLSLSFMHTHMHPFLLQIQPTQPNCLKVNLPYNYYPS